MEELPMALREKLQKLNPSTRELMLKDALQETRFSYFKSSAILLRLKNISYLQEIQRKYSRFLVYSAREWYISIPSIQHLGNSIVEKYLRLALAELMQLNIIQDTEGWNYHIVRLALILWSASPLPAGEHFENSLLGQDSLTLPSLTKEHNCSYCDNNWYCMAKDKSFCSRKKFNCLSEAGVHLCKYHGDIVFSENRRIGSFVTLEDGRRMWSVGNSDFFDITGMEFHNYEKHKLELNEFGEYEVTGLPNLEKDWFMSEPDEMQETVLRVRQNLTVDLPKQSFWWE